MISISGGHWGIGTGANGYIDEGMENIVVAKRVRDILVESGIKVNYIQDRVSKNQRDNVNWLVREHNKTDRLLDLHIHFNSSSGTTDKGIGTEVYVYSDKTKYGGKKICDGIVMAGGFKNRGVKLNNIWGMLRNTNKPCYYVELCFVNSKLDCDLYEKNFEKICYAIAENVAELVGKKLSNDKPVDVVKKVNSLSETGLKDMKELMTKCFEYGSFKVDHSGKVESMSDGQILDRLVSAINRSYD